MNPHTAKATRPINLIENDKRYGVSPKSTSRFIIHRPSSSDYSSSSGSCNNRKNNRGKTTTRAFDSSAEDIITKHKLKALEKQLKKFSGLVSNLWQLHLTKKKNNETTIIREQHQQEEAVVSTNERLGECTFYLGGLSFNFIIRHDVPNEILISCVVRTLSSSRKQCPEDDSNINRKKKRKHHQGRGDIEKCGCRGDNDEGQRSKTSGISGRKMTRMEGRRRIPYSLLTRMMKTKSTLENRQLKNAYINVCSGNQVVLLLSVPFVFFTAVQQCDNEAEEKRSVTTAGAKDCWGEEEEEIGSPTSYTPGTNCAHNEEPRLFWEVFRRFLEVAFEAKKEMLITTKNNIGSGQAGSRR